MNRRGRAEEDKKQGSGDLYGQLHKEEVAVVTGEEKRSGGGL